MLAPMAKARSFVVVLLIPIVCAASSSSRIAAHARPMREPSRRYEKKTAPHAEQEDQVVVLDRGRQRQRQVVDQVRQGRVEQELGGRHRLRVEVRHVQGRGVDVGHAARAVRDHVEVVQEDADHLAEPERHDRQVVAAEPEGRRPEEDAEERGQRTAPPAGPARTARGAPAGARRGARRSTRRSRRTPRTPGPAGPRSPPRCSAPGPAGCRCRPGRGRGTCTARRPGRTPAAPRCRSRP